MPLESYHREKRAAHRSAPPRSCGKGAWPSPGNRAVETTSRGAQGRWTLRSDPRNACQLVVRPRRRRRGSWGALESRRPAPQRQSEPSLDLYSVPDAPRNPLQGASRLILRRPRGGGVAVTPISRSKPGAEHAAPRWLEGPGSPALPRPTTAPQRRLAGTATGPDLRPRTSSPLPGVAALLPLPRLLTPRIFLKASPYENA